jgi:hypothetical protein
MQTTKKQVPEMKMVILTLMKKTRMPIKKKRPARCRQQGNKILRVLMVNLSTLPANKARVLARLLGLRRGG